MIVALRPTLFFVLICASPSPASGQETAVREYSVVAEDATVRIHVGTAGLFGFLGHDHEVAAPESSGRVVWNPGAPGESAVELVFDATALRVLDPDLPDDKRAKVQADMEADVIEVERYPEIRLVSTGFRPVGDYQEGEPSFDGIVEAELSLHGRTERLEVPVTVTVRPETLRARGEVRFKGSRFGIEQVGVAAGTVKTKDELKVTFDVVARRE